MITITGTTPLTGPPAWAVLERQLFDLMNQSVYPFLERYTHPDGSLIWEGNIGGSEDDFYESFYNWPLLYLLGGGDHLLELGVRQWNAVTRQLTQAGQVHNEYARRDDQFHQAESDIYFYLLCAANPNCSEHIERARRFAGLYMNEDPEALNYDPVHKIIRSPYNGSDGPDMSMAEGRSYNYSPGMARYGLPHYDIPGITQIEDLKDSTLARRMGEAMNQRMSRGDVVANLAVTSLVTNAYLLTGEEKYSRLGARVHGRLDRTRPTRTMDCFRTNVGLSGQVGEYIEGNWYGGLYGWTWPHGFYNVQMAALVAASNAYLLTQDASYLDLPRISDGSYCGTRRNS